MVIMVELQPTLLQQKLSLGSKNLNITDFITRTDGTK